MDIAYLRKMVADFLRTSPQNRVPASRALAPEIVGRRFYRDALVGGAAADDPLFLSYRSPDVIGPHYRVPRDWLPKAKSVLAVFLAFEPWLLERYGRKAPPEREETFVPLRETEAATHVLMARLQTALAEAGHAAVVPSGDARFFYWTRDGISPAHGENHAARPADVPFGSLWSERHAAYAAGLGTFSLSKGLITRLGVAGNAYSLVTDLVLPPTERPYAAFDAYCTHCGACVARCPAGAITREEGKDHNRCWPYYDTSASAGERYNPPYGCVRCQVDVPCTFGIPGGE